MMGYISYFNVVKSRDIISSPYNKRQDSYADRVIRGKILDRNGNVLAQTNVAEDGTETREYPYNNIFAHVVGYTAQGKSGLESVSNFELLTSNAFFVDKLKNEFQDKKNQGDNVVTTLDTNLQEAAYDALGSNKGAVVVMDPSTGKILAMVSKPDFDPNTVSQNWNELSTSEDSVLLNRATQGQYAPGSTFKLVTTLEFMRENADFDSYSYNCTGSIESGDVTIHCYGGHVHGQVTLRDSLAYSCNTSFSNIGRSLNADTYKDTAQELLFNKKLPSRPAVQQESVYVDFIGHGGRADDDCHGTGKNTGKPISYGFDHVSNCQWRNIDETISGRFCYQQCRKCDREDKTGEI